MEPGFRSAGLADFRTLVARKPRSVKRFGVIGSPAAMRPPGANRQAGRGTSQPFRASSLFVPPSPRLWLSFLGEAAMRTQVGIVGAGPAVLMLSHLLHRSGIHSIVLESRSRAYVEQRIRAGVLEQWAADLLVETGVGARLQREAMRHDGIFFCFDGALHHLDFRNLVGKGIAIYGQQEIVKDLIARRLADGGEIVFEVEDVRLRGFDGATPTITFSHAGAEKEIACDFVGGCDGFHGVCRPSVPPGILTAYERDYPFAWLGILAEAPPPERELIYAFHARGFALCSMRSPS